MFSTETFPFWELCLFGTIIKQLFSLYLTYRTYKRTFQPQPADTLTLQPDPEKYKRSQEYTRDYSKFKLITAPVNILTTLPILLFKLEPHILSFSSTIACTTSYTCNSFYWQYFVFSLIIGLYEDIMTLPLSLYATFVIEEKYGFNKQTLKLFFYDYALDWIISLAMESVINLVLIIILSFYSPYMWMYIWVVSIVIGFIVVYIYPLIIEPLFNKLINLPEGSLRTKLEELAKKVGFPADKILVIDGSKRSSHSNAYVTGLFGQKRIVLYDTLLNKDQQDAELYSEEQIEAVIAHELGHWAKSHIHILISKGVLAMGLMLYAGSHFIYNPYMFESYGFPADSHPLIGYSLFTSTFTILYFLYTFVDNYYSRKMEREADDFAVSLGYGEQLAQALTIMSKDNLDDLNPDPLNVLYKHSHPTVMERVRYLRKRG